jgi:phosphatidate cytidylyltransferase
MVADKMIAAVVWGLMMGVAAYELLYGTGLIKEPRLVIYSCVMAFAVTIWSYFGAVHAFLLLLVMAFIVVLYSEMMASHVKITFDKLGICVMGGMIIPFLLSSLVRIACMEQGKLLLAIPFIMAFFSDTGAYFIGVLFGKHKIAPVISPKKSWEGFYGGIVVAIAGMMLYGVAMEQFCGMDVNYILALVYGILGALGGVFGDLSMSVIKRQVGIKDYGNLIPGHGGVLDRFDSVLITAPLTEALLLMLPMMV